MLEAGKNFVATNTDRSLVFGCRLGWCTDGNMYGVDVRLYRPLRYPRFLYPYQVVAMFSRMRLLAAVYCGARR